MSTQLHCVYASTSGNTETVVERTAKLLAELGFTAHLHRAERTPIDVITQNNLFILATSTWEHGALNPFFRELLDAMKEISCAGKKAAFIGLGDQRYEPVLFCEGMEKVRKVWLSRDGEQVGEPLKIQGEPYHQLEAIVDPWVKNIGEQLRAAAHKQPTGGSLLQKLLGNA